MKKFKFKLEGLLKVRRFAEEKCRTELGYIQVMVENKRSEIQNEIDNLSMIFDSQETMLKQGIHGKEIEFFPLYIEGKRKGIEYLKSELAALEEAVEDKRHELVEKKAELKVIEKLKEKEFLSYKKEINKKMNKKLEEEVMIWSQFKSRG